MIERLSTIKGLFTLHITTQTVFLVAWFLLSGVCYAQTNAQVQVRVFLEGLIKPIPEMVRVNAGTFDIGIDNNNPTAPHNQYWSNGNTVTTQTSNVEHPQRQIILFQPFEVGRFEITREQFKFFLDSSDYPSPHSVWDDPRYYAQRADHPAAHVSWSDAQAYVEWLKEETGDQRYRLLSEAEWEYVARAGTTSMYSFGDMVTKSQANFDSGGAVSVGDYDANNFGLYDFHGNVWEWVGDCWHSNYDGLPADGSAWQETSCTNQVLRGGAWDSNDPSLLRSAQRGTGSKDEHFNNVGFRIARTLIPRLTIASPTSDTNILLRYRDTSVSTQVEVVINVEMEVPGTLKLESDDDSIISVPADIQIQPTGGSSQTMVEFTLTTEGPGNTIITISVIDDQGAISQVKIGVEARPLYPVMTQIKNGMFTMGSTSTEVGRNVSEGPQHEVTVLGFEAGRHEVTREQFAVFVNETGRTSDSNCDWENPSGFTQDDWHPVVCASWQDAQDYVKWLSGKTRKDYRLLSEAEWEYVARAGTSSLYSFGDLITSSDANYDNNNMGTVPVGSYDANAFGLHNVHGNVWEWVEDCWHTDYRNPTRPNDGSVWNMECNALYAGLIRGGGYDSAANLLRSASRSPVETTSTRAINTGFRVARTVPIPQIVLPKQNESFTLRLEDESFAEMKIPVTIDVIEPDIDPITMTLRLDSGGELVVSTTPSAPITFPPTKDSSTRTAAFTLVAQGVGETTLSIVVTDRLGNQSETTIRAIVKSIIPQMVQVEAGSFNMGSLPESMDSIGTNNERPRHLVNIPGPFAVSLYEITREEFKLFLDSPTGAAISPHNMWNSPTFYQQANHPAVYVTRNQARRYARWLSQKTGQEYRLLSESEWEYVARAGTTTRYHYGNEINLSDVNYLGGVGDAVAVDNANYSPNAWGLYHVHGNVWEWVEDCWHEDYDIDDDGDIDAPGDGSVWEDNCATRNNYVARGGSWNELSNNTRSASRTDFNRTTRQNDLGFRIARSFPITLISPAPDESYTVFIEGHEADNRNIIETTVTVKIKVIGGASAAMEVQLDPNDNSLSVPSRLPTLRGRGIEKTASFALSAKSPYAYSETTMTIVVTDDSGNTRQVRVAVETIPIPEMIRVNKGSFKMGAGSGDTQARLNEGPQHDVTIPNDFYVGKYEVTRGQYKAFVDSMGYRSVGCEYFDAQLMRWRSDSNSNWENPPGFEQTDHHPVTCVTWNDTQAYLRWLRDKTGRQSYRLLSESEWEYVARAGAAQRYSFMTSEDSFGTNNISINNANYKSAGKGNLNRTARVGNYPANRFGSHDVHGNVEEWVEDCWHEDYDTNNDGVIDAPTNGNAWTNNCDGGISRRVLRGGSWLSDMTQLRSSYRDWSLQIRKRNTYGFRIAR